ncbi:DegT/DnrJ/EryC1/StrS family aminotransferase [bacterium]|nr:DegT/DnrJ/EryC1/StrS family aminotransferase [bacterium]
MNAPNAQPVPLLDLKAQHATIAEDIRAAYDRVIEAQAFIMGHEVEAFEKEIAQWIGVPHAIGCASGSDALLLALMALDLEPGDEVITTPYTFFATVSSITRNGLKPVFCDIEPRTYNMDVSKLESLITDRTRVIMPVHLYGQLANMDEIMKIAERHRLIVIEDACQAIGAAHGKRRAGAIGLVGCFSFFPSKNLGGHGDGGLMTTADPLLANKLRSLRLHGSTERYFHKVVGINSRLDALQAAVLRVKLPHLKGWTDGRRARAQRYQELFAEAGVLQQDGTSPEAGKVITPTVVTDRHIFHQYVIRVQDSARDKIMAALKEKQIGHAIYYPLSLHMQECFAYLGYREGDMPQSERASRETLALPIYAELTDDQQKRVVDAIASSLK